MSLKPSPAVDLLAEQVQDLQRQLEGLNEQLAETTRERDAAILLIETIKRLIHGWLAVREVTEYRDDNLFDIGRVIVDVLEGNELDWKELRRRLKQNVINKNPKLADLILPVIRKFQKAHKAALSTLSSAADTGPLEE